MAATGGVGAVECSPMRQRLFTLLSAVSLLLCVATVGLWMRSYWVSDCVYRFTAGDHSTLATYLLIRDGSFAVDRVVFRNDVHPELTRSLRPWQWVSDRAKYPDDPWHGFRFHRRLEHMGDETAQSMIVGVPLWLPTLLFAMCPSR